MALDQNEKRFIEKLVEALKLLDADKKDIKKIAETTRIDEDFLAEAGNIFNETEACDVCGHAFHSWRRTLDDETVLSFIEDWIQWKRQNKDPGPQARVVKMRKRL
ncbi:MAG TPA: hypothetical protein VF144_10805 [Chitinophagaceae bacterium]